MRIVVTGAAGQVGTELVELLGPHHDVLAWGRSDLDVTDGTAVGAAVGEAAPDAVVNCAAYNAVDAAETDEATATAVNRDGPGHLAAACAATGAHLVHISTDYVFPGDKGEPYVEDDEPAPASAYGRSKLAGEQRVTAEAPSWAVVRTAWVFGRVGRSLVETILTKVRAGETLRMVTDQYGSPTFARDLAAVLALLATQRVTGLFHVTNEGWCSPHELAITVCEAAGLGTANVEAISLRELGRPAPRPAFSALASRRLAVAGIPSLRHYGEALEELVPQLLEAQAQGRTS